MDISQMVVEDPPKNTQNMPYRKKNPLRQPQRKMFSIQFDFLKKFQVNLQQVQNNVQKLLNQVTSIVVQEKKRLPYNIMKGFDKNSKAISHLKSILMEENKKYENQLKERTKIKTLKSQTFKKYLVTLNEKKQQLKKYISQLEDRVQNLQQNGYAQYIDFYKKIQEQPTIRFSYAQHSLLKLTQRRAEALAYIQQQLKINKKLRQKYNKMKQLASQKQQRQEKIEKIEQTINRSFYNRVIEVNQIKINENTSKTQLMKVLNDMMKIKQYKMLYQGQHILYKNRIKKRKQIQKHKIQIQILKKSIIKHQQQISNTKFEQEITYFIQNYEIKNKQNRQITKTDFIIYIKNQVKDINNRIEKKIFINNQKASSHRNKSI